MIYGDIGRGVPPAMRIPLIGEPAEPIEMLWEVLKGCWDIHPEERPSAKQVQEFVMGYRDSVMDALEKGFMIAPD
jgi:hypothetical protein